VALKKINKNKEEIQLLEQEIQRIEEYIKNL
jgi:HAMP domain-containing protein